MRRTGGIVLVASLATLGWSGLAAAQERQVVSNAIAVSGGEATLRLEFEDETGLEVSFRDGEVMIDGAVVGVFSRGDELDASWRALLGRVVALENGPLAEALEEWEPPTELTGDALDLAKAIDRAIEDALEPTAEATGDESETSEPAPTGLDTAFDRSVLTTLLLRNTDRLRELGEALDDLALEQVQVHVGEDLVVADDEIVEATVVVVDGDLDIRGEIRGNVVVTGGSVRLRDGSRVTGDVRLADSRLFRDGGVVEGRVRRVEEDPAGVDELRDEWRRELQNEIERSVSARVRREVERERSMFQPLRYIGSGLGGVMQNLITFVILSAIALGVLHFLPERLHVAATVARNAPGRSAAVGLAGAFLAFPVWIVGILFLCVTLIGIPVLIAWIPLFPLAVAAAAGLGYFAMAQNAGEWLADQHYQGFDWLERANVRHTVLAGIGLLLAAFVAANVIRMAGPWLGFLNGLLSALGVLATLTALVIGFGAVIMTRGGTRSDIAYAEEFSFRDSMWGGWSRRGYRSWERDYGAVEVEIEETMAEAGEAVDEAARESTPAGAAESGSKTEGPRKAGDEGDGMGHGPDEVSDDGKEA